MPSKKKKNRPAKAMPVRSRWELIKYSLRKFRRNSKAYLVTATVILIPSSILRTYTSSQGNAADFSLILFLAGLLCFLALLWLAQGRPTKASSGDPKELANHAPKVRQIYVASTMRFLPFLLVSLIIAASFIPFIVGAFVMLLAVSYGASILFVGLGVLVSMLAIYFGLRLSLAIVAVIDPEVSSGRAIKYAWRLSRRRWWHLFWNYLIYFVVIGILSGLVLQGFGLIPAVGKNVLAGSIINGVLLIITVPLLAIYMNAIYDNLGGRKLAQMANGKVETED